MKKNVKILPTQEEVKDFQNEVFEALNVGIVCPSDVPVIKSRFHQESIFDDRISYNHTIRVAKFFKVHENIATALRMQIQRACLNTLNFEGYHIGNYGIVFDKENGNTVCIVKGDMFTITEINKYEFAIQKGDKQLRIYKVSDLKGTRYISREVRTTHISKERLVKQDMEVCGIKNVKASESSWMNSALKMYFADYEGTIKKMQISKRS